MSKDAQHRGVGVGYPATEGVSANEHDDACEKAFEEIEDAYCANTDEIEDGALNTQIRKGLVQALEYAIATFVAGFLHDPSLLNRAGVERLGCSGVCLDAPKPSQNVRREYGDPCSGGNTGKGTLCAGLTVSELISANDDRD